MYFFLFGQIWKKHLFALSIVSGEEENFFFDAIKNFFFLHFDAELRFQCRFVVFDVGDDVHLQRRVNVATSKGKRRNLNVAVSQLKRHKLKIEQLQLKRRKQKLAASQ